MKPGGLLEAIIELSHERGLDQDAIVEAIEEEGVAAEDRAAGPKDIEEVVPDSDHPRESGGIKPRASARQPGAGVGCRRGGGRE